MSVAGLQFNLWLLLMLAFALTIALLPLMMVSTFNGLLFDVTRPEPEESKNAKPGRRRRKPRDPGPFIRVENGEISPDSSRSARYMGGPAILTVDEHSVAVLDKFGHCTRAVGIGAHPLGRCERVIGAIDLRPQLRKATSHILTRDGLPIAYSVEIEFRLLDDPLAGVPPRPDRLERWVERIARPQTTEPLERYKFSQDAARMAVYPLTVQEDGSLTRWGSLVERIGMGEIDAVIAGQDFDDLCLPTPGDESLPRTERSLRRRIQSEAEAAAARALQTVGARLTGLRFTSFTFDHDEARGILDQHFANWMTHWEAEMQITKAQGDQRAIIVEGGERAKAQGKKLSALAVGIIAALKNPEDVDVLAMLRALEAMEHLSLDQHSVRYLPREIYELIEEMRRMTGTVAPGAASLAPGPAQPSASPNGGNPPGDNATPTPSEQESSST